VTPPQPPVWQLRPAPAGAALWGLRYAFQFFFFALFVIWGFAVGEPGREPLLDFQSSLLASLVGPLLAGLVAGWLYWRSFEVELNPVGISVRRGVFTKRTDLVAYARMQAVVVRQSPLQRLLGLGDVLVQTAKQFAGGGGEQRERRNRSVDASLEMRFEGVIRHIPQFEYLRGYLLERSEQARVAPVPEGIRPPPPGLGAPARPAGVPPDLPGLFASAAAAISGVLAGTGVAPPPAPGLMEVRLQERARALWTVRWSAGLLVFYLPLAALLGWVWLAASPLALAAAHLAARVYFRHYRVTVHPESLEVERGLLTLRRAVVPYRRVQNVNVVAGPIERAFGLKTLRIEAAGPTIAEGYVDGIAAEDAAPLVRFLMGRAERARFDDALGDQAAARDARLQAVDELRAINALLEQRTAPGAGPLGGGQWLAGPEVLSRRWPVANALSAAGGGFVLWAMTAPILLLALDAGDLLLWAGSATSFALVFGALGYVWARARLRRFAFRFGPETLEVRHGVLFRSHDLIPYRRLQSVGVSSGPLERRLFGIWSVRLSTAGTSTGLQEFPGLVDPRPYADFLLAKARLSTATTGESPVAELAAEASRTAQVLGALPPASA
jgi:membrane protein YdbS with pleckstrin-like domain